MTGLHWELGLLSGTQDPDDPDLHDRRTGVLEALYGARLALERAWAAFERLEQVHTHPGILAEAHADGYVTLRAEDLIPPRFPGCGHATKGYVEMSCERCMTLVLVCPMCADVPCQAGGHRLARPLPEEYEVPRGLELPTGTSTGIP